MTPPPATGIPPARYILYLACIMIAGCMIAGCMQTTPPTTTDTVTGDAPPATLAVTMTVPFAPIPVSGTDGANLAYELAISSPGNQAGVPERVEVIDPATGAILYSADGEVLAMLYHPASIPPPTADELRDGTGKLPVPRVSLWFTVSPDAIPDRLVHRVTLNRTASGLPPVTVTGGEVLVRHDLKPVVIGSPMRGPGWVAIETTSPFTHHFLAQITMDNVTRVPQRYAQDWIYADPVTGQVASGNVTLAKNYFGYGREIHAIADGTVVDVLDGLPDIETIYATPPATIATAAGNFVIMDIGDRKYACYAHMIPGSIRVTTGDVVQEGEVLGLLGNSGNSDLPHLHFQVVTDVPSFLGAEGYPHVYRSFDDIGSTNLTMAEEKASDPDYGITRLWEEFGSFVTFFPQPVPRENMLPDNYAIVRFP